MIVFCVVPVSKAELRDWTECSRSCEFYKASLHNSTPSNSFFESVQHVWDDEQLCEHAMSAFCPSLTLPAAIADQHYRHSQDPQETLIACYYCYQREPAYTALLVQLVTVILPTYGWNLLRCHMKHEALRRLVSTQLDFKDDWARSQSNVYNKGIPWFIISWVVLPLPEDLRIGRALVSQYCDF